MSMRRISSRVIALATVMSAGLALLAPSAHASSPQDVCAAFPHRQTYIAEGGMFRAPAWHYGSTVTIVYETDACGAEVTNAGNYVLSIAGTASVYRGGGTDKLLDKRPFTSVIRSSANDSKLGWPIDWWSCFDGSFSYVWTIEGVYSFVVSADDGRWAMVQKDLASGESSGTIVNTCKKNR